MAPRAYWKCSLKLSLVTRPIALYPASTRAEKTHFHQINTKTGHRLKQQMVDERTGRVVDNDHKGRGYELSKGRYVEIDEHELEAVKLESTHTIEIDDFVTAEDFDERYLDKPYYIVPNGKTGADAFVVIRDAMKRKDKIALARVVLSNREPGGAGDVHRYGFPRSDLSVTLDGVAIKPPWRSAAGSRSNRWVAASWSWVTSSCSIPRSTR